MVNAIIYLVLAILAIAGLGLFVSLKKGIRRGQSKLLLDQCRLRFMEERK